MKTRYILGIIAIVCITIIASLYGYYRYEFPYRSDHRCNKILYMELSNYANLHNGEFPSGEATPEASLSLIQTLEKDYPDGYLLRRRDVPKEVVDKMLLEGKLLGPKTCGWNYVEGLRIDSDRQLALFWDKEGLTEMGARLSEGGHWVTFIDGELKTISAAEWDDFMANQKKLLAEEMAKRPNKGKK
jgi:hypothetical protein